MRRLLRAVATAIVSCAVALSAPAAENARTAPRKPSPFAGIAAEVEKAASAASSAKGTLPPEQLKADIEDYAKHLRWQREFARESWDWHLFSTKLLMNVVMVIVGFGLLITYLQFTRDGRRQRRRAKAKAKAAGGGAAAQKDPAADDEDDSGDAQSRFKVSLDGIEITSQVIGLLVLAFSLVFFYLYVKVVYPMQEVELQRNTQSVTERSVADDAAQSK